MFTVYFDKQLHFVVSVCTLEIFYTLYFFGMLTVARKHQPVTDSSSIISPNAMMCSQKWRTVVKSPFLNRATQAT
jgi:hypothetical protein